MEPIRAPRYTYRVRAEGVPRDGLADAARRVFVGREAELGELGRGLDDALGGRGRLYLLSGEPGIGKTRLADEVSELASARGVPVFWGRCWEAGGAPAFWPWLDVLAALADTLDDATLAQGLGDGASLVADLVPAVRSRLPPGAHAVGGAEESRFRLFRAVSGLLRRASAERGAAIVFEDLHAADESSLLLLHFVARELRGMRVFLLSTFRDVEARLSREIGEALGRLSREGTTLSLSRLGRDDTDRLVRARAGDVEPGVAARLFQRTLGNPLFVEEMVRLLRTSGDQALAPEALPAGVREVIRQRLSRVSSETRAWLELASVAGDETEPSFIAEAAGEPSVAVVAAFTEATEAGILVRHERQRFRFSHALVREALDRDLSAERKMLLHARVAAALERRAAFSRTPPLAELAHHLLEGPRTGLGRAVDYAVRAADRAVAVFAFEDAVSLLERARASAAEVSDAPALEARVLVALGRAQIRRGQGTIGQELCLEAAEIARALGDAELFAVAALAYGLEITAALVNPVLIALLNEALAALPDRDTELRVRVTARLAAALQPHPDLEYPIGLARGAISSARRIGDSATLLEALFTGMSAMMDITDPRERLALNVEVEQLATTAGDTERLLRTEARLVFDHMELGDFSAADARIDLFERLAREAGAARFLWRVPLFRSMRAMVHGRFAEAERLSEEARQGGLACGDPHLERCFVFHREGLLRAWERHDDMLALDPEARRMRAALYSGPHWQNGGSAFTHARVEDPDKIRLYLGFVPQDDWPLVHNPPAFMHLGEPLAFVGTADAVRRVYERLLPASHRCISWGWTGFVWDGVATRVLGLLAARLGMSKESDEHFEVALERLEALDATPYLARTLYEHGRTLLLRGDAGSRPRARALVEDARARADVLGMTGLVRLAERRLEGPAPARSVSVPAPAATSQSTSAPGAPSAPPLETAGLPFAFVPEGEYWAVHFDGRTFRLKHSLGVEYLARLFASPDRAIHVLELSGAKVGAEGEAIDAGDAGELLDTAAKESYKRRLADLRETLAEAESFGDGVRAARARQEIEFLAAELSRAVGLGGRARRAGGAGERARSAVQRRIRNVLERVREESPGLAEMLERTVKTGVYCVFMPGR